MKVTIAPLFASRLQEVQSLCGHLEIEELYFFGSSINGKFIEGKSDLDIFVNTSEKNIKNIVRLSYELRKMFGCSVDVFHKKWRTHSEIEEHLKDNKLLIYKRKRTATDKKL